MKIKTVKQVGTKARIRPILRATWAMGQSNRKTPPTMTCPGRISPCLWIREMGASTRSISDTWWRTLGETSSHQTWMCSRRRALWAHSPQCTASATWPPRDPSRKNLKRSAQTRDRRNEWWKSRQAFRTLWSDDFLNHLRHSVETVRVPEKLNV